MLFFESCFSLFFLPFFKSFLRWKRQQFYYRLTKKWNKKILFYTKKSFYPLKIQEKRSITIEKMNFEELKEIQTNEIEALKAIFMDDFREVTNKSAWKVKRKTK